MAKTFNLNPGADATLVTAATRAAMANVPHDLSGTFEKMAESYADSMSVVGEAWGQVAKIGGEALSKATKNFINDRKKMALGSTYEGEDGSAFLMDGSDIENEDGSITHVDGLNDIRDKYWKTFSVAEGNNPFSRENIAERQRLNQNKQKIFAQIDMLEGGFSEVASNFTAGNYDEAAMAYGGTAKFYEALSVMKTKTGKTDDGYHLKTSHDKNGDIILTLFDNNDNPVLVDKNDPNSNPVSMPANNIQDGVVTKNGEIIQGMTDVFENIRKTSAAGSKGVTWDHTAGRVKNQLSALVANENDLHHAMHSKNIWNFDGSFSDDMTNATDFSASVFADIGGLKLQQIGVVDADKDGVVGDKDDFMGNTADASRNYSAVLSALTNRTNKHYDEDVTREVFLDWGIKKGKDAWTYGEGQITNGWKGNNRVSNGNIITGNDEEEITTSFIDENIPVETGVYGELPAAKVQEIYDSMLTASENNERTSFEFTDNTGVLHQFEYSPETRKWKTSDAEYTTEQLVDE